MLRIKPAVSVVVLGLNLLLSACGSGSGGGDVNSGAGVSGNGPDIALTAYTGTSTAAIGVSYPVSFTVINNGSVEGGFVPTINLSPTTDLTVDATPIGLPQSFHLLAPGQSIVINITVKIPLALASGNYYMGPVINVVGDSNLANNTMASQVSIVGLSCINDTYESDNTAGTALPLLLGESQSHNHCDATSDWMRFDAVAQTSYGFNTIATGSNARAILRLYDSDGKTQLATSQANSGGLTGQRLSWTAPRTGTYYLRAAPAYPLYSVGPYTEYSVSFGDIRADLVPSNMYAATGVYAGGLFDASVQVNNIGFAAASTSTLTWYLSVDPLITSTDMPLLVVNVPTLAISASFTQYSTKVPVPGTVATGNWYVGVIVNSGDNVDEYAKGNNATPGSAFTVSPLTQCTADAYEEDDIITAAKPIIIGGVAQQHNLCDDGSDWYKFDATANTSYHVTSGESYRVIGPDQVSTLALDANGNFTATQNGTYYISVLDSLFANQGGNYSIKLDMALPDLNFYVPVSNSSNTVYAGGWIDVGLSIQNTGFIPSASYEWSVHRSTNINLNATAPLLASGTMPGLLNNSYMDYPKARVYFDKTIAPGTYYLRGILDRTNAVAEVREDNNLSDLSNSFSLITVTAPPCAIDAFEDDDSPSTASTILEASTQTHNNCDDSLDWVKFVAPVTGVYLATANRLSGSPDIRVLEADASTLAQIQRSEKLVKGSSVPYQASWNAVAGHTYYLEIDDSNNFLSNSGYAYTFTVKQCQIDAYEDDDTVATAKVAQLGVLQTRNHCEDNDDWILLNATQGTSYTIVASDVGSASSVSVDLFDSSGSNKLVSGLSYAGGKTREIRGWIAPASGIYYIRLYQQSAVDWGENTGYTLKIN
jgi:hypothetical protein